MTESEAGNKAFSCRGYLVSAASVLGAYCAALWVCENAMNDVTGLIVLFFLLFMLNLFLHIRFCAPGEARWYALPLLWALCVVPLYIASYHIIRLTFFGRDFTFQILGICTLAPIFIASLLTGAIWRAGRAIKRKRAQAANDSDGSDHLGIK